MSGGQQPPRLQQHLLPDPGQGDPGWQYAPTPDAIRRRVSGAEVPREAAIGAPVCCLVCFIIVIATCVASLAPNEYGITKNLITGTVGDTVHRGGIWLVGPVQGFLRFPATQVTVTFSLQHAPATPPIRTRTGADPNDPDSGGQPIDISCAFQFRLVPDSVRKIYFALGGWDNALSRIKLLSQNVVSNTAQEFIPRDFWEKRGKIADRMVTAMNSTLQSQVYVQVMNFQIMKVDFATRFEDSITAVQVAVQQKVINEYLQSVARVVQSIEVENSRNNAMIANISGRASAEAAYLRAKAQRDAFNLKQSKKADMYKQLKAELNFSQADMIEYFKIKALQAQSSKGKVVIGMPQMGATPTAGASPAAPPHGGEL